MGALIERLSHQLAHMGSFLQVHHIPGRLNEDADLLSRRTDPLTLPNQFHAENRIRIRLSDLWAFPNQIRVYSLGSTVSWLPILTG